MDGSDVKKRTDRNEAGAARGSLLVRVLLGMALLLSAPGGPQWVLAQAQGSELAEARQRLDTLYDPLEALRADIDRTTFDLDALGMELAFEDAEAIVEYVHEAVRFEPYKGVLRGAQGTLGSGGGNAIDQALLAATLLLDAGYEAEIRGATLSDQQVQLLLGQLRPGPATTGAGMPQAPDLEWDVDFEQLGDDLDAEVARLESDVERMDALLSAVTGGAANAGSDASARLTDVSREYHWIAYRFSAGEPWTEAHPVFGGEVPTEFAGLEASQAYDGDIPTELLHRFSFQVFVERRLGDELVAGPVMDAWERPVANMYGVALTYASVPDGAEGVDDVGDVAALMDATNFFYPMLEGDLPAGGQAFDMLGTIVPPDAANSPYAGLFQTVSGAFGSALGALGNLGADAEEEPMDDAVTLTAQWFEFTFTAPGEEPVTHRRMVVDRLGAEAREAGQVRLDPSVSAQDAFAAIASAHTFMLDTGRYAEEYVLDRSLESVISMREFVDRALVCAIEGIDPPNMTAQQSNLEGRLAPLSLFAAFSDGVADDELVSYRPAPAMVVLSQRIDGTHSQVDVVANPRWSLRVGPDGVRFDAAANRRAGVWETRTEALPLQAMGEPVIPAFGALEGANSAGNLRLLREADLAAVAGMDLPYESRAAIAEDLVSGYEVVLPADHATRSLAEVGWWRVDPVTGETLGRGGDGRGQSFVDYLTSLEVSLAITAGFTVYGVDKCTKEPDPRVAGCCIVQNLAMAGAGMGLGIGLGVYYGTAHALKLFLLMDVGANVGGLFIPNVCS